ncbi:MAG TPA: MFS transporter [Chloroflexota bacterium]|nr:MFS transporter [Chloroflexota bacterium]
MVPGFIPDGLGREAMADGSSDTVGRLDTAIPGASGPVALLCATSFALGLNDAFLNPILPDIARGLGVSIAVAGQLATTTLLVGAPATLVLGVLSDLHGRRAFLLGGLLIAGFANVVLAVAPGFAWALVGRLIAGFGLVFAINLAVVGDWYAETARDRAIARVLAANALAWVVGVPGIAAVVAIVGWRLGVGALGTLFVAIGVLGLAALSDRPNPRVPGNTSQALAEIWRSHRQRPNLWLALLIGGTRAAYWTAFLTYAGGWLHDAFQLPTWQLGPVFTMSAIAYMAGIEVGSRWAAKSGPHAVIVLANVGAGILALLLPATPWLLVSLVGFAALALLCGAGGSTLQALTLQLAPASRGATMSLSNSLISVGGAFGVVLAGVAIAALGYPGLGLVSGVLAVATVLLSLRGRSGRRV